MNIKLDYFYFSTFDFELKSTKILKHILFFSREKHVQKQGTNYQVFETLILIKIFKILTQTFWQISTILKYIKILLMTVLFDLVSLLNSISTFMSHLMWKPSL